MACPPHFSASNGSCAPTCPLGYYNTHQYNLGFGLNTALAATSILTSLLVLVPYLAIPSRRKWPSSLLAILFGAITVVGIGSLIPALAHGAKDWLKLACYNKTTLATRNQGACAISATIAYGVAMFGASIWFCLALNMSVSSLQLDISNHIRLIASLAYSILPAVIGVIIINAKNVIQGSPANGGGCFIDVTKANGWYYDALWTIPLSFMFVFGTISVLITAGIIIKRAAKNFGGFSWRAILVFIKYQPRILFYLFLYWYAVLIMNAFRFYTIRFNDKFEASVTEWYTCLAMTWGAALQGGSTIEEANELALSTCGHPHVPRYAIVTWVSLSVGIAATLIPLIFFFDRHILRWWKDLITWQKYEDVEAIEEAHQHAVNSIHA